VALFSNRYKEFLGLCREVFNTEDGKKILAYLKSSYVDGSAMDITPEKTAYNLGKKELIQSLLQHVSDQRSLDEIVNLINNDQVG